MQFVSSEPTPFRMSRYVRGSEQQRHRLLAYTHCDHKLHHCVSKRSIMEHDMVAPTPERPAPCLQSPIPVRVAATKRGSRLKCRRLHLY